MCCTEHTELTYQSIGNTQFPLKCRKTKSNTKKCNAFISTELSPKNKRT